MTNEYDAQAEKFLSENGITFETRDPDMTPPPWADENGAHGMRWTITLSAPERTDLVFPFWASLHDLHSGKAPTAYSVLACISGDTHTYEETHAEWCASFGIDEDSIKGKESYERCRDFSLKLTRFFTSEEIEQLQEIQ